MFKLDIVDDEVYVLKSIKKRIESSRLDLEVCGTATNAEEALKLYDQTKPDIYLVDINLPSVSGLELIDRIRARDPQCRTKFIIVSGYGDFKHLQAAIRLRVQNYIRKPIQQEELESCLKEICETLRIEKKRREMDDMYQSVVLWQSYIKENGNRPVSGSMVLLHSESPLFRSKIILDRINIEFGSSWKKIRFSTSDRLILLWHKEMIPDREELQTRFQKIALPQGSGLIFHTGEKLTPCVRIESIEKAYYLCFTSQLPKILDARRMEDSFPEIDYDRLEIALESSGKKVFEPLIRDYMKKVAVDSRGGNSIREVYQSIVLLIANKYREYNLRLPVAIKGEFYPFAQADCKNSDELIERLMLYAFAFHEEIEKLKVVSKLSDEVERYIELHYTEELSLAFLAREFFVPPAYLTKRFKEMKNRTVMQQLKHVRMTKACEFLEITDLSVSEIAEKVGYSDSNYFTRVFRKAYKQSPSDYRSKCANNRSEMS